MPADVIPTNTWIVFIVSLIIGFWMYAQLIAFSITCLWKLFKKAGEHGWAVFVPFYKTFVMYKIAFGKGWYAFLTLIPFFAYFLYIFVLLIGEIFSLFSPIVALALFIPILIWDVIMRFKLAKAFGKGTGFGFGLLFLPLIFQPILALGKAEYVGPARQNSGGEASFPEGGQD